MSLHAPDAGRDIDASQHTDAAYTVRWARVAGRRALPAGCGRGAGRNAGFYARCGLGFADASRHGVRPFEACGSNANFTQLFFEELYSPNVASVYVPIPSKRTLADGGKQEPSGGKFSYPTVTRPSPHTLAGVWHLVTLGRGDAREPIAPSAARRRSGTFGRTE
jgi:hypothetical protein